MTTNIDSFNQVQDFISNHPQANIKCSFGEGLLRAFVIKITHLFKGEDAIVNTLFLKIQNDTVDAATLRWFSKAQLNHLIKQVSQQQDVKTKSSLVFQNTIGLTTGNTQKSLVANYLKIFENDQAVENESPELLIARLMDEKRIPDQEMYKTQFVVNALGKMPAKHREEILLLAAKCLIDADEMYNLVSDTLHTFKNISDSKNSKELDIDLIRFAVDHSERLGNDVKNGYARLSVLRYLSVVSKENIEEVKECARLLFNHFDNKDVWEFRYYVIEVVSELKKGKRKEIIQELLGQVKKHDFEGLKEFYSLLYKNKHVDHNPNKVKVVF